MSNYERCYLIGLHLVIVREASDTVGFRVVLQSYAARKLGKSRASTHQNGSTIIGVLARDNPAREMREPREKRDRAERD